MPIIIEKINSPTELSEGPHWDIKKEKLYYVDIIKQKILKLDPATGQVTSAYLKDGPVGFIIPVEGIEDKFVVGCGLNIVLVTWNGENGTEPYIEKISCFNTKYNDMRINDGKCDSHGRLWTGTMAMQNDSCKLNNGAFYSLNENLILKEKISSIGISNGITWSPENNVMYYIDSLSYQIWAYNYNDTNGNISNKRVVFDLKKNNIDGLPDGMTTDINGNLWIAIFNGSSVIQVAPTNGNLLRTIKLPVKKITSVCFGGPNFDILYVTTAGMITDDINEFNPDGGCLYSIKGLGVQGYPPNNFKYSI